MGMNIDEITDARRRDIAASIHSISLEEVKALGEKLFPACDDPWRESFFDFLAQNPHETFHHATTHEGIEVLYCHAQGRGIWFLPGRGLGPLQPRGLKILNEIVLGG
jgi:hypothetical protein